MFRTVRHLTPNLEDHAVERPPGAIDLLQAHLANHPAGWAFSGLKRNPLDR
jgi:hypothetical protein